MGLEIRNRTGAAEAGWSGPWLPQQDVIGSFESFHELDGHGSAHAKEG